MISPIAGVGGKLPDKMKERALDHITTKSEDRTDRILRYVDPDDEVLDVGCVQHSLDRVTFPNPPKGEWLHEDLCRVAESVHGIDVVESEVKTLNEHGYSAEVANAESFSLDCTFDTVVAGELIEHLSNPGKFLDRCHEHLRTDGSLIITTPNPRRLQMVMWFLTGNESNANPEHTMWYDPYVMETLASRHSFTITKYERYLPAFLAIPRLFHRFGVAKVLATGGWVFVLTPE
jgi:2-polyprenyl-3-methyl-5-hydroxy-6-metoxy-1,4-benzoquinol methylase